jgi:hypothetical protein
MLYQKLISDSLLFPLHFASLRELQILFFMAELERCIPIHMHYFEDVWII